MPWMQTFVRGQMRRAKSGEPASVARAFTLFFQPMLQDKQQEIQMLRVMVEDLKGKHIKIAN
ncbi:hypothetical protein HBH56_024680 [Parastagonospora nodorum]|uniref:Uncharacterized protein n=1 Tax=Phaeosphaeria nodorum (strain SN15 / ATCC MYA-4574 / FGSC 10173) TaxID=321614 RepID=A0A7U2I494_PHANO|nr:hypothetical protein HBH56_024680 [Parastagonospora nodorum]QRC98817.1 hypothetical protein JI435_436380 [Parastagonospora nodorum SN15]KAH3934262.1 hypothetical protein HBH54_057320 [Parastagonospora nodorum]KAH3949639.1 hypothetical protein HBH53_085010 [Parastagonospora nodorum]KAH3976098.1 hypothetical protein HBH51_080340 [Parastagonospora nodorum]